MNKTIILLLLSICLGVFSVSAEKKVMTVKSNYHTLYASAGAKVVYNPESSKGTVIEINGPSDKINWVDVTVANNTLYIRPKAENGNRIGNRLKGVTITVNGPLVRNLRVSSSGKISSTTWLEFRKSTLSLSASSSGEIKLANVSAPTVIIKSSSSGDIELSSVNSASVQLSSSSSGDVEIKEVLGKSLSAKASSSGDIKISSVACDNVSLSASSSADIKITKMSAGNVSASSSSSGDIVMSGKADHATLSASSGGDVDARNLNYSHSSIRSSSGGSVYEK